MTAPGAPELGRFTTLPAAAQAAGYAAMMPCPA